MNNNTINFTTRFAPSPTGALHVGNIRTALLCWLMTKKNQGKFILRIDNTDESKSSNKFTEQIKNDLTWIGIDWDYYFEQKDRKSRYLEVAERLKKLGMIYPCYETKDELEEERRALKAMHKSMIYRHKPSSLNIKNRQPHWRFKINLTEKISWIDTIKNRVEFDPRKISDPIVIREDGSFTYMLPSSVDDIDYNITTVLRGDDHITNTAIQIQMIKAIEKNFSINFAHIPLLHVSISSKISKRNKSEKFDIETMQKKGILPTSIKNYLCDLGTNITHKHCLTDEDLIKNFSTTNYNSSSCQFNFESLEKLNSSAIKHSDFEKIKLLFPEFFKDLKIEENSWHLLKKNLNSLEELKAWDKIINSYSVNAEILLKATKEINLLKHAAQCLPSEKMNLNACEKWIKDIKYHSDSSLASIYKTLRFCLTGISYGPELFKIFELLGRHEVLRRLKLLCNE